MLGMKREKANIMPGDFKLARLESASLTYLVAICLYAFSDFIQIFGETPRSNESGFRLAARE